MENAFCRVLDDSDNSELCRYTLAEKGSNTGVVMGVLSRSGGGGGGWSSRPIGAPANGRTAKDLSAAAIQHV